MLKLLFKGQTFNDITCIKNVRSNLGIFFAFQYDQWFVNPQN